MIIIAACTTVLFVSALNPTSTAIFVYFSIWLTIPYVVMGVALLRLQRKGTAFIHWHVVVIVVSVGGIVSMANVIFWNPDAQGGIAVLMTPMLQCAALVLLVPLAGWLSRRVST